MPNGEALAWVYSLEALVSYPIEVRHGAVPLLPTPSPKPVTFGRKKTSGVSVPMTRDDHPSPRQVSVMAGQVFVGGPRNVFVANSSTSHSLFIRKWPGPTDIRELPPILPHQEKPPAQLLGEGLWWIYTTQTTGRVPGWILVDVPKPSSGQFLRNHRSAPAAPARLDRVAQPPTPGPGRTSTDPDPGRWAQPRRVTLREETVDFLVRTFVQYFTLPPAVRPVQVPMTTVASSQDATTHSQAIIKAARPGTTKFKGLYTADLLPSLFEGSATLTFSDVQKALARLDLLD